MDELIEFFGYLAVACFAGAGLAYICARACTPSEFSRFLYNRSAELFQSGVITIGVVLVLYFTS